METIGARLVHLREIRKLKREYVMKTLSISNLARYETGERSPNIETMIKLAKFYNVSIDWIATGEDSEFSFGNSRIQLTGQQKDVAEKEFSNLVEEQVALLNAYEKLDPTEKDEIWTILKFKLSRKMGLGLSSQESRNVGSGTTKTA